MILQPSKGTSGATVQLGDIPPMTTQCAPYMGALKIFGTPGRLFSGLHGYFFLNFSWAFVPIDPVNMRTKFEVCSFTRS